MPQPGTSEVQAKLRARYGNKEGGGMRRKKFRQKKSTNEFEKRLQANLKKLSCKTMPEIEEVNLFKSDGTVIHFISPKVDAEVSSNVFIVSGNYTHNRIEELLPDIYPQIGSVHSAQLAFNYSNNEMAKQNKDGSKEEMKQEVKEENIKEESMKQEMITCAPDKEDPEEREQKIKEEMMICEADHVVAPQTPQQPREGARAFFSDNVIGPNWSIPYDTNCPYSDYVGEGSYPQNREAFPTAAKETFDAIAIDVNTRVILWEKENFQGKVLLDVIGPKIINNIQHKSSYESNYYVEFSDSEIQKNYPANVRVWSETNMNPWTNGSVKIVAAQKMVDINEFTEEMTARSNEDSKKEEIEENIPQESIKQIKKEKRKQEMMICEPDKVIPPQSIQQPKENARAYFSDQWIGPGYAIPYDTNGTWSGYSDYVGEGSYPRNKEAFPNASRGTFDAIAIDANTRVILWEKENFQGKVLLDVTGPKLINNVDWKNDSRVQRLMTDTFADSEIEKNYPPSVRIWSETNMHSWSSGSVKIVAAS